MTGGTGFIGSHIAAQLMKRGYPVWVMARSARDLTARKRVAELLDWLEVKPEDRSQLRVVEGYLDRPHLGLDQAEYDEVREKVGEIIHCASSTSFSERKRAEAERANISSLRNLIDLAIQGRCYYFHHLSTAYVAGKREGICDEDLVATDQFHNVYEETKYRGEKLIQRLCSGEGIRLNVYRPSIVYGNSQSGRSLRFNALYYPIRTVLFLRNLYEKDLREDGGKRAQAMGVREMDGTIWLPIRLEAPRDGGINLIPIDYLLDAFIAIMEECLEGGIFHIVSSRPKEIGELIEYTQRMFRISGMRTAWGEDWAQNPRNALEILFESYVEAYTPYIRDTRIFANSRSEPILQKRHLSCPDLDFETFRRCMKYAVETGWGTKLFQRGQ